MTSIFSNQNNKHNELADVVIEGAAKAYRYFFENAEKITDLKEISMVELQMFHVFHAWATLKSHLQAKGAEQADQMVLLGTIMAKFSNWIEERLQKRDPVGHKSDPDFWNKEFKDRIMYYQKVLNDSGNNAEVFMQKGYKKIFKSKGIFSLFSKPSLHSPLGKIFVASAFIVTTCVEDKFKEII